MAATFQYGSNLTTTALKFDSDTLNENVPAPISKESWLYHFKSLHSVDPTNSTHEH